MDPESLRFPPGPDRGLRRAPHKRRELKLPWRTKTGNSYSGILTRIPEWRMAVVWVRQVGDDERKVEQIGRDERTWESDLEPM